MKKLFALLVTLAMLAGCGTAGTPSASTPSASAPAAPASDAAPAAPGEKPADYPTKPITFILPVAAGGAVETGTRIFQPELEAALGVPLAFEFYGGADSMIGYNVTLEQPSDGYTLCVFAPSSICNTILNLDSEYNIDSFDYFSMYENDPIALFVHKTAEWSTFREFLDYAKANPKGVSVGVSSMSDVAVVGLRQLEQLEGIEFNIVPFAGGGKARTAMAGQQIDALAQNYFGASSIWEDTRVLTVFSSENNVTQLAGIPTAQEVVGKEMASLINRHGIVTPAGFREQYPDRAAYLEKVLEEVWNSPELKAKLAALGQEDWLEYTNSADTRAKMDTEMAFYKEFQAILTAEN